MGETINKLIFRGRIQVKSGQVTRHPPGGKLDTPWTGFFFHNLSDNYLFLDVDADAGEAEGFPIYDWDWKSIEDFAVQRYISFYGASAATVFLWGYTKVPLEYIAPDAIIGGEASPIAKQPRLDDPTPPLARRKIADDLTLGPDYDYEQYLSGGQG